MSIYFETSPLFRPLSGRRHQPSKMYLVQSPEPGIQGGTLQSSSGKMVHLRHYHTFGRSQDCHTILSRSDISRIHAIFFWKDGQWFIQDKSTNGIWVNERKLAKDQPIAVRESDTIVFSSRAGESFTVIGDHEPCDVMLSVDSELSPIYLEKPVTVVSETVVLSFEGCGWHLVVSETGHYRQKPLKDGDHIDIDGKQYYLQTNRIEYETQKNRPVVSSVEDLTFQLTVSDDEEDIQLQITDCEQSSVVKGARLQNQLYLLLCLARKVLADNVQGYAACHCGWIELNELSEMLGIEPENTRIRLHRLRTRLRDAVSFSGIDACEILQLKDGEVRLNTKNVIVMKGGKVEGDVDSPQMVPPSLLAL
ncbi:FHA domain-containing protein [Photobacterium atrarenae]|uniref:FHA domain-containing protein n=1 Tax=Photobacterium atrarenae TaxID=865757 RepID=A0ABY5GPD0_9GAMM|nr:FHA domain-containing protein [Photobacterium atrarenae]UTV30655.1 FHA domain-containing protein [Photobacterium atrarenae]